MIDPRLIEELTEAVGRASLLTGSQARERLAPGPRGRASVLVQPRTTAQVSAALAACHRRGQAVVPVGGQTGLVDGAYAAEGEVALSLERMTRIEEVDRVNRTLTAQAGVVLQKAQAAAEEVGLFLPLDLGARGSATLGGNVSTNAGGNRVLRFGTARSLVLGLEAVLADGTRVDGTTKILKNNTGYDLKQLFIGSEGTLGIVTRVVLRLWQRPTSQTTALVSLDSFDAVSELLSLMERRCGARLSSFEVMWRSYYELVTTAPARGRPVVPQGRSFYVLCETLGTDPETDDEAVLQALSEAQRKGWVGDAVVARSQAQRDAIWALRDDAEQTRRQGPVTAYDVSLPIDAMAGYVSEVDAELARRCASPRLYVFGHIADGNLHLAAGAGPGGEGIDLDEVVYGSLPKPGSSISAEHGIGLAKRKHLALSRSPAELALMRTLKSALDPRGILNPGKVL